MVFFEAEIWWEYDIYWLLKSSYRELFRNGKYGLVMSQNVDGKMIFTDYWKVLVLNFSVMRNMVFSEPSSWWKSRLVFSRFFDICGNLWNVKEKPTRKLPAVKWSAWLYATTFQNFARRHFFDVNGVSIAIS